MAEASWFASRWQAWWQRQADEAAWMQAHALCPGVLYGTPPFALWDAASWPKGQPLKEGPCIVQDNPPPSAAHGMYVLYATPPPAWRCVHFAWRNEGKGRRALSLQLQRLAQVQQEANVGQAASLWLALTSSDSMDWAFWIAHANVAVRFSASFEGRARSWSGACHDLWPWARWLDALDQTASSYAACLLRMRAHTAPSMLCLTLPDEVLPEHVQCVLSFDAPVCLAWPSDCAVHLHPIPVALMQCRTLPACQHHVSAHTHPCPDLDALDWWAPASLSVHVACERASVPVAVQADWPLHAEDVALYAMKPHGAMTCESSDDPAWHLCFYPKPSASHQRYQLALAVWYADGGLTPSVRASVVWHQGAEGVQSAWRQLPGLWAHLRHPRVLGQPGWLPALRALLQAGGRSCVALDGQVDLIWSSEFRLNRGVMQQHYRARWHWVGFSGEQLASGMQVLMQLFIYVQQALLEGETLVLEGLDAGRVVCALTGGKQHEP